MKDDRLILVIVGIGIVTLIFAGISNPLSVNGSALFIIMGILFVLLGRWLRTVPVEERKSARMWAGFRNTKNWEKKSRLIIFSGLFLVSCGVIYSLWYVFVSSDNALPVTLSIMMAGIIVKTMIHYRSERSEDRTNIQF